MTGGIEMFVINKKTVPSYPGQIKLPGSQLAVKAQREGRWLQEGPALTTPSIIFSLIILSPHRGKNWKERKHETENN